MVIGFEYTKYKPKETTVMVRTPVEWGISGGARGTGYYDKSTRVFTPVSDPVRRQKKTLYTKLFAKTPDPVARKVVDPNTGGGGFIDRTAYFEAGKYPTYNGLPEYYQAKTHELPPSREQFVSEGGLFGEPLPIGEELAPNGEGLYGDEKPFDWVKILLLIGGLILLFIIVAVF